MSDKKNSIMIVDDQEDNHIILRDLLEDAFEVQSAYSGEACLKQLDPNHLPITILLDLTMPGINGFDVCERLKSNSTTEDIPIIFVTAETRGEEQLKAYEKGGDDFISKPFNHDELLVKIFRCITYSKKLQELKKQARNSLAQLNQGLETTDQLHELVEFIKFGNDFENHESLGFKVLKYMEEHGLMACLQFTTHDGSLNMGNGCKDGSIEAKLINAAKEKGKIVSDSRRVFYNEPHFSMLIKNMPDDLDGKLQGLKDHLELLSSVVESIAKGLNYHLALDQFHYREDKFILGIMEELSNLKIKLDKTDRAMIRMVNTPAKQLKTMLLSKGVESSQVDSQLSLLLDIIAPLKKALMIQSKNKAEILAIIDELKAFSANSH